MKSIRDDVQVLDAMLAGLDRAPAVYQAAPGWKTALDALTLAIRERGLATFRSWPESSGFNSAMHPYLRVMIGLRKYSFDQKAAEAIDTMQRLVIGYPDIAFLPYRISLNELRLLAIARCDDYARAAGVRSVRELDFADSSAASDDAFVVEGKTYTVGALTYYLRYAYLSQFVSFDAIESVVELGSGDGCQAEIIKKFHPHVTYYMVDIPPVLYVGGQCMEAAFPHAYVPFTRHAGDGPIELPPGSIGTCGNWQLGQVRPRGTTLFISCASLGEMHRAAVANYLDLASQFADWVYLMQVMEGRKPVSNAFVASDDVIRLDDYVAGLGPAYEMIDREPAMDVFGPVRDDFTYENALWKRH
ncbi:MAG: putative sugar O-methyltransferase [Candidatus Lustribacter sp.]|jgi:putative sugar O-methyltransferase